MGPVDAPAFTWWLVDDSDPICSIDLSARKGCELLINLSFPAGADVLWYPLVPPCVADDHPSMAWDTTVSCENAAGALGCSYRFDSIVKNGMPHGANGDSGRPGWFQLDGKIASDGKARFYADGLIGAFETAWDNVALVRANCRVEATFPAAREPASASRDATVRSSLLAAR